MASQNLASKIFKERSKSTHHPPRSFFILRRHTLPTTDKEKAKQSLGAARAKGFTPGGLHVLERQNYDSVLKELEVAMTG